LINVEENQDVTTVPSEPLVGLNDDATVVIKEAIETTQESISVVEDVVSWLDPKACLF